MHSFIFGGAQMPEFEKEELMESYFPSELILVKDKKANYKFAVNYYPGISAVKVLNGNKDYLANEVEYADFTLTDPNKMCVLSRNNPTKPFQSHFVKDFHFGKGNENRLEFRAIKNAADKMMEYQKENGRMPIVDILAIEKNLNEKVMNIRAQFEH